MKHYLLRFVCLACIIAFTVPVSAAETAPKKKKAKKAAINADNVLPVVEKDHDSRKRVALVIGNSTYTNSPLKNPVNDAKDIAIKLRGLGFEVIERSNLKTRQIGGTLREFRSKLAPGAVALVFYAGHGFQIKGDNYLPAVDADINSEEDVPNQSLSVKQIMDVLEESKSRLNLVFLDACRNNPYARSFRSGDRGLARVSAPSGTLISYATKPGSVAADGTGRNGLYTSKLLAQMDSNKQIEQALKRVVTEVKAASQGKQEPWMEGSIEGDFCFRGCAGSSGEAAHAASTPAIAAPVTAPLKSVESHPTVDPQEAKFLKDPFTGMEFVHVHEGCFTSSNNEVAISNVKEVCLDAFRIGKYEVTQGQYKLIMDRNPSHFSSCGNDCPVEQVSWNDTQTFINRLKSKTGKNYRLPTEVEWEYACTSGGMNQEYCGGKDIDAIAWHQDNSGATWYDKDRGHTHVVGQKQANGLGIYDMSGNVTEWVQDWYGDTYPSSQRNPTGEAAGSTKVLRGGSWQYLLKANTRSHSLPSFRDYSVGLRLVLPYSH